MCTAALEECINYYTSHDANVNMIFLNATKAYGRVEYVKLFRLLIQKKIYPMVLRLMVKMYTN